MGKEYWGIAICEECGTEVERVQILDVNGPHLAYPEDWSPSEFCGNGECQNVKVLTKEIAEEFLEDFDSVELREFTAIEDAAAESLANTSANLHLGMTRLSDAAAEILSKHHGDFLHLNGLTKLSDAAAESLGKHQGEFLSLNGLTRLSLAAVESLGKHKGLMGFEGLTELSDEAAETLGNYEGWLNLPKLTQLSDAAIESLSNGAALTLDGLTSLSDAAAESLGKHKGDLYLNGLTQLSDVAAVSLSKYKDGLSLLGLTKLLDTPGHIALAKSLRPTYAESGCVYLNGLTELSEKVAEALIENKEDPESDPAKPGFRGHYDYVALGLDGLTELSSAVANILVAYKGQLCLNGLSHLSDEVAETLGKHKGGGLYLNGLVVTSEHAANNLIKHPDLEVNILDGTSASAAQILRDAGHGE